VSVIDTSTGTEIDVDGDSNNGITRIPVGSGPFGIDITPDGTKVYVGNEASGDMSVIDTATNSVTATIDLLISGNSARTPAVNIDGTEVWIGIGAGANTIKRFRVSDNTLLSTIGGIIGGAVRLEFLPDGSSVFAQNQCGACGNLQKIDTTTFAVSQLNYGTNGLASMAIAPDGSDIYVGTGGVSPGQVREVNSSSLTVTRTLSIDAPTGIALSPDGDLLYIIRSNSDDVVVIRRSDFVQVAVIPIGDQPSDIVIKTVPLLGDADSTQTTFTLVVNNVAPDFEAGLDEVVQPSASGGFNRTITFTDPGADLWSGTVNFGDSTGDVPLTIDQLNKSFAINHTYATDGTYPVTVTVEDGDTGSHTDTFNVQVIFNTPPVANAGGPYTGDEGASVNLDGSSSTDAENNIVGYNWTFGDATMGTGISPSHTYIDDGTYTVCLTVTDAFGKTDSDCVLAVIANIAPTIALSRAASTNEGSIYTLTLGVVIDPGTDTVTSYIVDWGDTTTSDTYTTGGAVTHTYADGPSSPVISIDLVDEDGTHTNVAGGSVTVNNVPPTVAVNTSIVTINESETANNTGTYGDVGDDVVTLSASAGTVINNGNGTWSWSFNSTDGPDDGKDVTITATDSDQASTDTTFSLGSKQRRAQR
jgi:YVTN family beta-propeller protein